MVWLTSFWKTGPSQVVKNIKQCKCKMCPFSWNSSVHIAWRIHEQTGLLSICAMFSDIMSNFFVVQWLSSQSPWDREPCPAGSTVSVQPYSSNCESYSWPAVRPRIFYSLISILLFFFRCHTAINYDLVLNMLKRCKQFVWSWKQNAAVYICFACEGLVMYCA